MLQKLQLLIFHQMVSYPDCIYIYIYIYIHIYISMYVHTYACMYVCVFKHFDTLDQSNVRTHISHTVLLATGGVVSIIW